MNKLFLLLIAFIVGAFVNVAYAQDVLEMPKELNILFSVIGPYLSIYAVKYPVLGTVLQVMIMARLVVKPLMSAVLTIAGDVKVPFLETLRDVSGSKVYKTVAFVLDWLISLKLPKKK